MSSQAPAWIQAAAALATLLVMGWLAKLTADYVRTTKDLATATRQQVEAAFKLAQDSDAAVAGTLLAELERIKSELGGDPEDELTPHPLIGFVVPSVPPWVHGLFPQAARLNPAVPGLFMTLDRDLHNHKTTSDNLTKARSAVERHSEAFRKLEDGPEPADIAAQMAAEMEAKRLLDRSEESVRRAIETNRITWNRAHETAARAQEALRKHARQS